ncbi:unnamed protein product, partial [Rotaria magnacalcarata]
MEYPSIASNDRSIVVSISIMIIFITLL